MTTSHAAGAWSFPFDPESSVADAPILWRPELVPVAVLLAPVPKGFDAVRIASLDAELQPQRTHDGPDGRHILVDDPAGPHQLWCFETDAQQHLGVLIPLDADFRLRLAADVREEDGRGPEKVCAARVLVVWVWEREENAEPRWDGGFQATTRRRHFV